MIFGNRRRKYEVAKEKAERLPIDALRDYVNFCDEGRHFNYFLLLGRLADPPALRAYRDVLHRRAFNRFLELLPDDD